MAEIGVESHGVESIALVGPPGKDRACADVSARAWPPTVAISPQKITA